MLFNPDVATNLMKINQLEPLTLVRNSSIWVVRSVHLQIDGGRTTAMKSLIIST